MKKLDKQAILEGLKELIRTCLMAFIPLIIVGLQSNTLDWKAIGISAAIAFLSGIDRILHEKKIETPLDLKSLDKMI